MTADNVENIENTPSESEVSETPSVFDYSEYDFSFVKDKYHADDRSPVESAFEQAKAYSELEKKLGAFTGAPESYELSYNDDLKAMVEEKGLNLLEADDPRIQTLFEYGKELGMSQDGINKLIELDVMDRVAEQEAYAEFAKEQIESLGRDGQQRIDAIAKWAEANLGDQADDLLSMATDASQFKALEKLINLTKNAPVVEPAAAPAPAISMEEIQKEQFKTDEYGQRLMSSSPEHRKKVEAMLEQYARQQG